MKRILTFFVFLFAFSQFISAQNGWINLTNSAYTGNFNDVYFLNADTGYTVGSTGDIIITKNGGMSGIAVAVSTSSLNSIAAINDSTLLLAGDNGKIYKSTNYGLTWVQKTSGTTSKLNKIFVVNDTLVFVGGVGGVFFQSDNAGETWSNNVISGFTNEIKSLYFSSTTNGFAVGATSMSGFISKTTSSGLYWNSPYNTISTMNDIDFSNSTNGFAVGENGAYYKTINSGSSWSYAVLPTTQHLHAIQFVNSLVGYIVGDSGLVLKTINGGSSWTQMNSALQTNLLCVHAETMNLVYIGGALGSAMKTNSGGYFLNINVPDYAVNCQAFTNLNPTTNYNGIGTLTYSWWPAAGLNDSSLNVPTAGPLSANKTYYVTVTDGVLSATDTCQISLVALNTDSVCLVSVDDSTNSNLIIFEKHISGPIDFYKIYRESTVTNVWDSIGIIPADSVGLFVDTASNPAVMSYRYRISVVDSCGLESVMSNPHTTMHLNINAGVGTNWNLLWNAYNGVFVQKYYIWRGTNKYNLQLYDSVPGTSVSYTDINAPLSSLYYQVEIVSAYTCQPYNYKANTNYNSSRSNTAHNAYVPPLNITADFGANPLIGNLPLSVTFTDSSTQNPTYWLWDFGDGQSSALQNPVHVYNNKGLYTVSLIAWNQSSTDTMTKTDLINVQNVGFENLLFESNIKLIPNPVASGQILMIELEKQEISSVELLNILGESVIFKKCSGGSKTEIQLPDLSKGIYIVKVSTRNKQSVVKKLIIK